ncbi:14850_t:CDS:2 [Racocetra fulgida]|uniref:14850_t:CDS:1 n=1 Tax=Racocetra fulgida TaxID=60492 RepID=A0A9N9E5U3_9GLOM|nr:14850_t:CDS:2 [Racocetra fulgida]
MKHYLVQDDLTCFVAEYINMNVIQMLSLWTITKHGIMLMSESSSLASSDRKNKSHTMDTRKKMDRRGDAIIRKTSGGMKLEFGGSEAEKHYEGQNATK